VNISAALSREPCPSLDSSVVRVPHRAPVILDVCAVHDDDVDVTADPARGSRLLSLPLPEHPAALGDAGVDHGGEEFVLALEVIVKVAP
jgi:hypothetical protein